jgi:hypothetical protein
MDKYVKDGKVAVLYSPNYGGGWYSWNEEVPELLFDADIVKAVLANDAEGAERIAKEKYSGICTAGAADLKIEWLPVGTAFEIEEYDGAESVHVFGTHRYHVA